MLVDLLLFSCSVVWLFATWSAECRASPSFTISWSLLKFMSIELVMPSNHLVPCCPFLLPSISPSFRVFSNELSLYIRWSKYWSFSFTISPSNGYSGLVHSGHSINTGCSVASYISARYQAHLIRRHLCSEEQSDTGTTSAHEPHTSLILRCVVYFSIPNITIYMYCSGFSHLKNGNSNSIQLKVSTCKML